MTKSKTEKPAGRTNIRLREFTRHEREEATHPSVEALQRRPQMRGEENRKAMEYARIERGQMS
ncbi:hypothetical protein EYF88_12660 [Paracoccus sediminis]|uniref:Uncharacterized protein n=1 Tax=Paracoccus sediminis TaxID=1214787 RepID=A0A238X9I0_9RHOB|nr:hypothetical protein [Paracoccus sediminis]TBN48955.1 hypothetical protein EYF88_12660 [Paracoccus sediminis]SNR55014.1 hypothetical protein SAMN06265378_108111 [Paracoccus sediminis]